MTGLSSEVLLVAVEKFRFLKHRTDQAPADYRPLSTPDPPGIHDCPLKSDAAFRQRVDGQVFEMFHAILIGLAHVDEVAHGVRGFPCGLAYGLAHVQWRNINASSRVPELVFPKHLTKITTRFILRPCLWNNSKDIGAQTKLRMINVVQVLPRMLKLNAVPLTKLFFQNNFYANLINIKIVFGVTTQTSNLSYHQSTPGNRFN